MDDKLASSVYSMTIQFNGPKQEEEEETQLEETKSLKNKDQKSTTVKSKFTGVIITKPKTNVKEKKDKEKILPV